MAMFNGPAIKNEIIEELMKSVSKPEDLLGSDGILKQLTARLVEKALQAEMSHHLGYESGDRKPGAAANCRNACLRCRGSDPMAASLPTAAVAGRIM